MKTISVISKMFDVNWGIRISGLQEDFVCTQVKKRMKQNEIFDLSTYINYLEKNVEELEILKDMIFIHHSLFFRNPLLFEELAFNLFPKIILEKAKNNEALRIWSSGCAKGEEPYSLAIILNDIKEQYKIDIPITIIATDIDSDSIEKAKKADYDFTSLENVKYKHLQKYFIKKKDVYSVSPSIKDMLVFETYDMIHTETSSPPSSIFGGFDMVFFRNVLIYFDVEQQKKALIKVSKNLNKDGILIIGNTENIINSPQLNFVKIDASSTIYQKA